MASYGDEGGPAVRAEGLTKVYPNGVVGLDGLSVTIGRGELVGLLGRSGSGKTTLFRSLVGAIRPTAGTLEVLGVDMLRVRSRALRRLRRRLGWVSQQHNLVPSLSVAHNVLLGVLGSRPLWSGLGSFVYLSHRDRAAAHSTLAGLGVADKLYDRADDLSGGQQQRVAVARALVGSPELLLADEPVASVDASTADDVMSTFEMSRRDRRTTIVVSLHQPDIALRYCPRILLLERGQVVYDGSPEAIDRSELYRRGADRPASDTENIDAHVQHTNV